jgi:Secretion system C-terminal sorting domain/The GLUG motif
LFTTQTMLYATGGNPTGSGTAEDPFLIADYADLKVVGTTAPYTLSAVYRLTADIDASASSTEHSDSGFVPIGSGSANFTGTFHGAGHVIKNLYINHPDTDYVALFGCAWTATIDSLGVTNVDIKGRQFVGAIVASSYTTITNCYSTGNVTGSYQVGGVVGDNLGQISNCYASGNVIGVGNVGGIVGYSDGIVSKCYSTGNVTGSYQVGGVVGDNDIGLTANCYSTGNITGINVGGVVGLNGNSGTVSNCYAIGNVTGDIKTGGVVGEIYDSATVSNCYWNTQTTGMSSGYGTITDGGTFSGTGLTTAQMKLQSSYSGWDFTTVWSIDSGINNGYPYLASGIATSVKGVTGVTPKTFTLLQNYPNPFNPSTQISYQVPSNSRVSLKVFDLLGREVAALVNEVKPAGTYTATFNADKIPSGVYFYQLSAGNFLQTKKILLMK